jgi:hypothetical protein
VQRGCIVRVEGPDPRSWPAVAYDLSAVGVGLALSLRLPVGSVLVVEPWGAGRPLRARLVRADAVSATWMHGCVLTEPLSEDELQAWSC